MEDAEYRVFTGGWCPGGVCNGYDYNMNGSVTGSGAAVEGDQSDWVQGPAELEEMVSTNVSYDESETFEIPHLSWSVSITFQTTSSISASYKVPAGKKTAIKGYSYPEVDLTTSLRSNLRRSFHKDGWESEYEYGEWEVWTEETIDEVDDNRVIKGGHIRGTSCDLS